MNNINHFREQRIGIFDSGTGGLTVAREIKKALPSESIIYFGDTLHLPYGDKSPFMIQKYSQQITRFLVSKGIKALVIACNSASAHAYESVSHIASQHGIPVINVIDPVVQYVKEKQYEKVLVIGTKATIQSKIYSRKIKQRNRMVIVYEKPTPLFVPLIEEGLYKTTISKEVIHHYLSDTDRNIDAMILGCTHYPLIEEEISGFFCQSINILNSAKITAKKLKEIIYKKEINNTIPGKEDLFYLSDMTEFFEQTAKRFFGREIKINEITL
jgi:glutamate racemase